MVEELQRANDIRTPFQRDRDRILYSKAFRRLARKTQVFFSGHDDHIRTRLTHTLEVSQIARTIASHLGLDLDLTEAISLGHDIGHAPFGHVGERVINYFANGCESYKDFNLRKSCITNSPESPQYKPDFIHHRFMGFKHNWQAVRIVEDLAVHKSGESGMRLSPQTVFGMLFHTKTEYKPCDNKYGKYCKLRERGIRTFCKDQTLHLDFYHRRYDKFMEMRHFTLEAAIVAIADEIAQRHHDMEDGLRFDLIRKDELLDVLCENGVINGDQKMDSNNYKSHKDLKDSKDEELINRLSSYLVGFYVNETIRYLIDSVCSLGKESLSNIISSFTDYSSIQKHFDIDMVHPADKNIRALLKKRMLNSYATQGMDGRADFMLRRLFKAYISNPQQLPDSTIRAFFRIYVSYGDVTHNLVPKDVNKRIVLTSANLKEFTVGELRDVLKERHTTGRHIYKGSLLRAICDLISGMTDHKAHMEYRRLYGVED
jgi:dGTPase